MNRADEIRDQLRQMRYLCEEKKFIDDMLRKIEDQKNRLQVEELQLTKILRDSLNDNNNNNNNNNNNRSLNKEFEEQELNNNFFSSGTPSRPIEIAISHCFPLEDNTNDTNHPKAVVETIELDVSKVLLKLASGGNQVEQESDDDNSH